jgi:hypothetical protein
MLKRKKVKDVCLFLVIPIAFLMLFQFIFFTFTFKSLDEFLKSQFFWSIVTTLGFFIYKLVILLKLKKETEQQKSGKLAEQIMRLIKKIREEEGMGIVRKARFESSSSLCTTLITVDGIFLSILGTGSLLIKAPNLPILLAFIMLVLSMIFGLWANDWLSIVADIDDQRVYIPNWKEFWQNLSYQYHLFIIGTIYLFLGVIFHLLS